MCTIRTDADVERVPSLLFIVCLFSCSQLTTCHKQVAHNSAHTIYSPQQPALSVGNVPQLAVDLFASSLDLAHVCNVDSDALLPLCGCDSHAPPHTGELCTPAELFRRTTTPSTDALRPAALQLRTPPAPGAARRWCTALAAWVRDTVGAARTVLLVTVPRARALPVLAPGAATVPRVLATAAWGPLEGEWEPLEGAMREDALAPGSVAAQLFGALDAAGVPAAVVAVPCAEGDNVPDAVALASWCAQFFGLVAPGDTAFRWRPPPSWNASTSWGAAVDDCASEYL